MVDIRVLENCPTCFVFEVFYTIKKYFVLVNKKIHKNVKMPFLNPKKINLDVLFERAGNFQNVLVFVRRMMMRTVLSLSFGTIFFLESTVS